MCDIYIISLTQTIPIVISFPTREIAEGEKGETIERVRRSGT